MPYYWAILSAQNSQLKAERRGTLRAARYAMWVLSEFELLDLCPLGGLAVSEALRSQVRFLYRL